MISYLNLDLNGDDQAEGRLEKLNLTLLNDKKRSIYKPITQNPTPYTEDNQDEYLKAYWGTNFDDEHLENENLDQLMIGKNMLLVSDMEAFRAANPGCCFEDFIHWYSPNDFIEAKYDEQTGQLLTRECLSERFQSTNCLWRKNWQSSKAIPVSRQKRIFNYSVEAERVLDYLNAIKFEDLMKHLFSTIVQIGCLNYKQIIDNCLCGPNELSSYFDQQIKRIAVHSKQYDLEEISSLLINLDRKVFDHLALIYLFRHTSFNQANALYENSKQFNGKIDKQLNDAQLNEIVNELAKNKFYRIRRDEELGLIVFNGLNRMFSLDNLRQSNDDPLRKVNTSIVLRSKEKEFTFVADCARPANYSRKLPQKLHFKICSNDESRKSKVLMNGQFSEDIVYF